MNQERELLVTEPVLEKKSLQVLLENRQHIFQLLSLLMNICYLKPGSPADIIIVLNRQHMLSKEKRSSVPLTTSFACWWRNEIGCTAHLLVAAIDSKAYPSGDSGFFESIADISSSSPFFFSAEKCLCSHLHLKKRHF